MKALRTLIIASSLTLFSGCDVGIEAISGTVFGNDSEPMTEFVASDLSGTQAVLSGFPQEGFIPLSGQVLNFNANGTGSLENYYSDGGLASPFSWSTSNGLLTINYENVTSVGFPQYIYPYNDIAEIWGQAAADEAVALYDSGFIDDAYQFEVRQGNGSTSYEVVESHSRHPKIRQTSSSFERTLVMSYFPNSSDHVAVTSVDLTLNPQTEIFFRDVSTIEQNTASQDAVGEWMLPIYSTISSNYGGGTQDTTTVIQEKFSLLSNGTFQTHLFGTIDDGTWTFNQGILSLTSGSNRFDYIPIIKNDSVMTSLVHHYENGQRVRSYVSPIAKFSDSFEDLRSYLPTALPIIQNSYINLWWQDNWDGSTPDVDQLFGYVFEPNGHLIRGVSAFGSYTDGAFQASYFGEYGEWSWNTDSRSEDGRPTVVMDEQWPNRIRTRYWDVISISNGFLWVLEHSKLTTDITGDSIPDAETTGIYITPRMNLLKVTDLNELYPQLWQQTDWDNDGLTNGEETTAGTNFQQYDTDADSLSDGDEVNTHGTDPNIQDTDSDGFTDGEEVALGTDPLDSSSTPGNAIIDLTSIVDAGLRSCIQSTGETQVANITVLSCPSFDIQSIDGIEQFISLENLDLNFNQISDLTPLTGLTNLVAVTIEHNQISSVAAFENKLNLERLWLSNNQIGDVTPLANLPHISLLEIDENQIANIAPLSTLISLTWLEFDFNQVTDISPLASLVNLQHLRFENNLISDISSLNNLTALESLIAYNNQISDISVLSSFNSLQSLQLQNNLISDLTPLATLSSLSTLLLDNNSVIDLTPLGGLTGMTVLDLQSNQVVDITALFGLTGLTSLDLQDNTGIPCGDLDSLQSTLTSTAITRPSTCVP